MKKRNGRKEKIIIKTKFLVVLLIILALLLLVLFVTNSSLIKKITKKATANPQKFSIEDRCTLIVGKIIHTIGTSDSCQMSCKAECEARERGFYSSELLQKEKDCNECSCYCK